MKVYCVGYGAQFLELRALVLQSAGFAVYSGSPEEAADAVNDIAPDVILIASDISAEDVREIESVLDSNVRVIRLEGLTLPRDLIAAVERHREVLTRTPRPAPELDTSGNQS